jgi:hypothetical protein
MIHNRPARRARCRPVFGLCGLNGRTVRDLDQFKDLLAAADRY